MGIKERIKNAGRLKLLVHLMLYSKRGACPRFWVRWFVNPVYFMNSKSVSSRVRRYVRLHISPINGFSLGKHSVIEYFSVIDNGVGSVEIGDNVRIGLRNTIIGPVKIGDNVILAQNVVVSGLNHNYENPAIPIDCQGVSTGLVEIGAGSWIGANVVIAAGRSIGRNCIVGAGSVVTHSIPDFSVAVGNPAKVVKQYDNVSKTWMRHNMHEKQ